jgi:hypothetical protein
MLKRFKQDDTEEGAGPSGNGTSNGKGKAATVGDEEEDAPGPEDMDGT